MKIDDLLHLAKGFGIPNYDKLSRAELEEKVLEATHKHWEKDQKTLSKAEREALTQFHEGRKQAAAAPAEPAQIVTKEERQMATAAVQQQQECKVSKSDLMRQLYDEGLTVAQIAKRLKSNYSFVYSVIKRYKEEGAPKRTKTETKSDQMRRMFDQGMTVAQIAKKLNANYAFVYGVIKRYKEELGINN